MLIDLRNAKEGVFQTVPPGQYDAVVTAVEEQTSKAGAPMLKLTVELRSDDEFAGTTLFDYLITSDQYKGAGLAKRKLGQLGFDVETQTYQAEDLIDQLLGLNCLVNVGMDNNQARTKEGELKWSVDANGAKVPLYNNKVNGYAQQRIAAQPTAPAQPRPAQQAAIKQAPVAQQQEPEIPSHLLIDEPQQQQAAPVQPPKNGGARMPQAQPWAAPMKRQIRQRA